MRATSWPSLSLSFASWHTKLWPGGFSELLLRSDWLILFHLGLRERERESELEVVMGSEQEAGDLAHAIGDRNFHTRGFYFNGRLTAACLGARTRGGSRSHPSIHPSTASAVSVHPCLFRLIPSNTVCTIQLGWHRLSDEYSTIFCIFITTMVIFLNVVSIWMHKLIHLTPFWWAR